MAIGREHKVVALPARRRPAQYRSLLGEAGSLEAPIGVDTSPGADEEGVALPDQAERRMEAGEDLERCGSCLLDQVDAVCPLVLVGGGGHPEPAARVDGEGCSLWQAAGGPMRGSEEIAH